MILSSSNNKKIRLYISLGSIVCLPGESARNEKKESSFCQPCTLTCLQKSPVFVEAEIPYSRRQATMYLRFVFSRIFRERESLEIIWMHSLIWVTMEQNLTWTALLKSSDVIWISPKSRFLWIPTNLMHKLEGIWVVVYFHNEMCRKLPQSLKIYSVLPLEVGTIAFSCSKGSIDP